MNNLLIPQEAKMQEAIDLILANKLRTVFVSDAQGRILGCLTEGDILRAVISGAYKKSNVSAFMNTNFIFQNTPLNDFELASWFLQHGSLVLPILDPNRNLIEFQFPLKAISRIVNQS